MHRDCAPAGIFVNSYTSPVTPLPNPSPNPSPNQSPRPFSALDSLKLNDKALTLVSDGYLMVGRLRQKLGISHDSNKPFTVQLLGKGPTILRGAEPETGSRVRVTAA